MNKRTCLDANCPDHNEPVLCTRRQFHNHVLTKPTEKLIHILTKYDLVKMPESLSRLTLVNLFIDFCTEPVASYILERDSND